MKRRLTIISVGFTAVLLLGIFSFLPVEPALSVAGDYLWVDKKINPPFTGDVARVRLETATDGNALTKISYTPYRKWSISKLDRTNGNILWTASWNADFNWYDDLLPDNAGGFYSSGLCDDFDASCVYGSNGMRVNHYDTNGNALWDKGFPKTAEVGIFGSQRELQLQLLDNNDVLFANAEATDPSWWRLRRLAANNGETIWGPITPSNCDDANAQTGLTAQGNFIFACVDDLATDILRIRVYDPLNGTLLQDGSMSLPSPIGSIEDVYGTADGGYLIKQSGIVTKVTSSFATSWTATPATDVVVDDAGQYVYISAPQAGMNVWKRDTSNGNIIWTKSIDISGSFSNGLRADAGGLHVAYSTGIGGNGFYAKIDFDGNFLVGAQNITIPASVWGDANSVTPSGDALLVTPDNLGGATLVWESDRSGTYYQYGTGIEGVPLPTPPSVPTPPLPPPTPPAKSFPDTKRLSVYDGIIWIVGGAPSYDVMQLGNAGRDILATSGIFFAGNGGDSGGAYLEGLAGTAAQRLAINAGNASFPALQLSSSSSPALQLQQLGTGLAAKFIGDVYVTGDLEVLDDPLYPGTKSSIVDTSQGETKLYAIEAPDARFADYGEGKVQDEEVFIPLDPTFAETIEDANYHVTLTAIDETHTLAVADRTNKGFTVKGESGTRFYYEVVGIRKGYNDARFK
ncbi:MAG: hypothetical protein WCV86_04215 [Patescibacteria group bacterium]|jgi:hypothetical protein